MGYGMDSFFNEIVDCQYTLDLIFWVITSSIEKYACFGHSQEEFEMMASISINKVLD